MAHAPLSAQPGYSGTPLVRKLGIKPALTLILLDAPPHFETLLVDLPADVTPRRGLRTHRPIHIALAFSTTRAAMNRHVAALRPRLDPAGSIWAVWPKKASGVPTDLTEDVIRDLAVAHKLVDNKVCAITQIWSGLRLVIRIADRPAR